MNFTTVFSNDFAQFIPLEPGKWRKAFLPEWQFLLSEEAAIRQISDLPPGYAPLRFEPTGWVQAIPPGLPLAEWPPTSVSDFFEFAEALLREVEVFHQHDLLLLALFPDNIFYAPQLGRVMLLDLSLVRSAGSRRSSLTKPAYAPQGLAYIAPEQTGRTQGQLGPASDYFSIGVLLLELLSGSNPFQGADALNTTYRLLTTTVEPGPLAWPDLHPGIWGILNRLLAKDPHLRYESLSTLKLDLQRLRATPLEQSFQTTQLQSPSRALLQGFFLQPELEKILHFFHRLEALEGHGILLVEGVEGSGKSLLNRQALQTIPREVLAITTSFSGTTAEPFAVFSDLILQLVEYAFILDHERLAALRQSLTTKLHNNAGILASICPAVLQLTAPGQEEPALPPRETQNRLAFALSSFLQAFQAQGWSLFLQFDEAHQASALHLQILNQLLYETPQGTLLVGLYFEPGNPRLAGFCQKWQEPEIPLPFLHLQLGNWDQSKLESLLQQQNLLARQVTPMAALLLAKTGGNPARVLQMLRRAQQENLLHWVETEQAFVPDLVQLQSFPAAETVAAWQILEFANLSPAAQHLLQTAALLGRRFKWSTLQQLLAYSPAELATHQAQPLQVGMIETSESLPGMAQFTTDGLPTHLLARLPDTTKETLWLEILTLVAPSYPTFEALHYVLLLPPRRTRAYRDLLEKGAREAIQANAFDRAYQYLTHQFQQLETEDWATDQEKCFALGLDCLRYAQFDEGDSTGNTWIQRLRTRVSNRDQLTAWATLSAEIYTMQANHEKTFATLRPVLQQFGVYLPLQPSLFRIIRALVLLDRAMAGKSLDYVRRLPNAHDRPAYLQTRLLQVMSTSVFLAAPQLTPLLMSTQIRLALRHGLSDATTVAFASYGFKLAAFDGRYERANEMIALAHAVNQRYPNPIAECVIHFLDGTFVQHFSQPLPTVVRALHENIRRARENGVLSMAYYSASSAGHYDFFAGTPLAELQQVYLPLLTQAEFNGIQTSATLLRLLLQAAENYRQATPSDQPLVGSFFQLPTQVRHIDEDYTPNDATVIWVHYFLHLAIFNQSGPGPAFLERYTKNWRSYSPGTVSFVWVRLLLILQCCRPEHRLTRRHLQLLRSLLHGLKQLAQANATARSAAYHLAAATLARYQGQVAEALTYYEKAIDHAARHGQNVELLLAWEAKATLLTAQGLELQAHAALVQTWRVAKRWGAEAKCAHLKEQYPQVVFPTRHSASATSTAVGQGLDLLSFIRVSSSITRAIKLEQLLENLLPILAENAGAQRGTLLLPQGQNWVVYGQYEAGQPVNRQRFALREAELPQMMVQYTLQSRSALVLDHALADRRYSQDPYLQRHQVLSALCLPITQNQNLKAILYLENNSMAGAFTPQRLHILELLSAQIAIALENALLYEEMETRVEQRTAELQRARDQSEELLLNILPREVAEELKTTGQAQARYYASASVMFTDFVNFTQIAEALNPADLVNELDFCFRQFDAIIDQYPIEKIKTIGDAYLCVCGLPVEHPDHATLLVKAALEIRDFLAQYQQQRQAVGQHFFEIRIGIDSGPVVAGVVGTRKFAYDIWGNTVNTAARMEQNSAPGRINVSGATWALTQSAFHFSYRGKIAAKNKGEIDMYWVEEALPPLSSRR